MVLDACPILFFPLSFLPSFLLDKREGEFFSSCICFLLLLLLLDFVQSASVYVCVCVCVCVVFSFLLLQGDDGKLSF